jgi:hypothetical protein
MPRGDRTGPFGEGPMTGRSAGYCAGYATPGFAHRPGFGRGAFGSGMGYGRGGGRGNRNRFYATGVPFSAYAAEETRPSLARDEEIALLKSESQRLRSVLENIEQRLGQLETT